MTPQQKKAVRKVKEVLNTNPLGLSFGELMEQTRLSKVGLQNTLDCIDGVDVANGLYVLKANEADNSIPSVTSSQVEVEHFKDDDAIKPVKKPRNKPFTPNPTRGYEVQKGKVKIFLDRRASSKVLTLSIDDLEELVNAVKKVN